MSDEAIKKTFFAPVMKAASGKYECVLSDTALDRDDEFIGKKFLDSAMEKDFLPGFANHENDALGMVCEWVNKRVVGTKIDGETHYALKAEPRFFMSNPKAQIIKGLLDDGAQIGISIIGIPSKSDSVQRNGKSFTQWTEGEILTADWVGIAANKHAMGRAAVTKAFDLAKQFDVQESEVKTVEQTFNHEEFSKSLLSGVKELVAELQKSSDARLEAIEKKFEDLSAKVEKSTEQVEKADENVAQVETSEQKEESVEKKYDEREKQLEDLKKSAPAANTGVESNDNDNQISVGTFIKAYNAKRK